MTTFRAGDMVTSSVRLLRPLGEGGMGTVWVAEHLGLSVDVAVKFVHPALLADPDIAPRFRREAAAAAKIRSPHVVQMLDHGVTEEQAIPFIVMELLEGESLAERIERSGPIAPGPLLALLTQVAKALGHAHAVGVVHRDIKPENIFLQTVHDEVVVKVLDFGIAKQIGLRSPQAVTASGALLGTPAYMSPEQVLSPKYVDASADTWALAVVAYEALTGELPFRAESVGGLFVEVTQRRYVPPTQLGLPPSADGWAERAFAELPEDRFESPRALVEALAEAIAVRPVAATRETLRLRSREEAYATTQPHGYATAPESIEDPVTAPISRSPEGSATRVSWPLPPPVDAAGPEPAVGLLPAMPPGQDPAAGTLGAVGGSSELAASTNPAESRARSWLPLAGGLTLLTAAGVGVWQWTRVEPAPPAEQVAADVPPDPAPSSSSPPPPSVPAGMVRIEGGTYTVGCPSAAASTCFGDEPQHEVRLAPFAIMKREVTVGEYAACAEEGPCAPAGQGQGCTTASSSTQRKHLPVTCVDWSSAATFCREQGWRLPSEAEWEVAARGADGRDHPWGDEPPTCARAAFACGQDPTLAGSHPQDVSPFGVLDLGGSVREWTASDYGPYPGAGPTEGEGKVNRGGSWAMKVEEANVSYTRVVDAPEARLSDLGFRCAADLE